LREFPLLVHMFKIYYKDGKIGTFEWETRKTEENEPYPQNKISIISTNMVVIDTWIEQLKQEYHNYKKKNYKFGMY